MLYDVYATRAYITMDCTMGAASVYGTHELERLLEAGAEAMGYSVAVTSFDDTPDDQAKVIINLKKKEK